MSVTTSDHRRRPDRGYTEVVLPWTAVRDVVRVYIEIKIKTFYGHTTVLKMFPFFFCHR